AETDILQIFADRRERGFHGCPGAAAFRLGGEQVRHGHVPFGDWKNDSLVHPPSGYSTRSVDNKAALNRMDSALAGASGDPGGWSARISDDPIFPGSVAAGLDSDQGARNFHPRRDRKRGDD